MDFFDLSLLSSCKFEYSLVVGVDKNVVTALLVVTDMYTQEKHFQNVLIIQSLPLDLFFLKISFALHNLLSLAPPVTSALKRFSYQPTSVTLFQMLIGNVSISLYQRSF